MDDGTHGVLTSRIIVLLPQIGFEMNAKLVEVDLRALDDEETAFEYTQDWSTIVSPYVANLLFATYSFGIDDPVHSSQNLHLTDLDKLESEAIARSWYTYQPTKSIISIQVGTTTMMGSRYLT